MAKIENADKNLKIAKNITEKDVVFYDVKREGFSIYGLPYTDDEKFRRIPKELANNVNEGVALLHANTSGGRVIFETDSPYIAIRALMPDVCRFSHMPLCGTSGFDMYADEGNGFIYAGTFVPPYDMTNGYESILALNGKNVMRKIMLNFPLYNDVSELYIGLKDGSAVNKNCNPYKPYAPIYYYGSSITQGGCASRPGTSYQSFIAHSNNIDFVNLGFSGSACGEKNMAEFIAEQNMSAFVLDFDHNAKDAEMLKERHYAFYETIRQKNADLPIIMVTAPVNIYKDDWFKDRRDVIWESYTRAKENGDENVYFIDGKDFFTKEESSFVFVDGCHPNDLGFKCMAREISKVPDKIFKIG